MSEHAATIHAFDSLAALRVWRPGIFEPREHQNLFDNLAWFETFLAYGLHPAQQRLILASDDARAGPAALFLVREGAMIRSASSYYSALFGPVFAQPGGDAAQFAHALAEWLARERVVTLNLHPIEQQSPFWQVFSVALKTKGFTVHDYFAFGNCHHPTTGLDYAHYLASRPSRLRNTIGRTEAKLAREPGCTIEIVTAPGEQLERAIDAYQHVYTHSWKSPELFSDFVPQLCRLAAQQGWLRLGVLRLDGLPAAAQIWLVKNGVASIYKLAYDERFATRGVGTALSAALSRHVLDNDKVNEIDFLSGDDEYKREWMSQRRERHGLIAYNKRTLSGLLGATREVGKQLCKNMLSKLGLFPARAQ